MKQTRDKKIEELITHMYSIRQEFLAGGRFSHPQISITFSQWMVIEIISKYKKASIDQISKALHITSSAATQLVNALEKSGYVKRKTGDNDKRFSNVELSLKTKKLFASLKKKRIFHIKKLFSHLKDEELALFLSLIKKITNH